MCLCGVTPLPRSRDFATKCFVDLQRDAQVLHRVQDMFKSATASSVYTHSSHSCSTFSVKDSVLSFKDCSTYRALKIRHLSGTFVNDVWVLAPSEQDMKESFSTYYSSSNLYLHEYLRISARGGVFPLWCQKIFHFI